MSKYMIRATGPAGMRGFSYSPVQCSREDALQALCQVGKLARDWTEWERIQVTAYLGRGKTAEFVGVTIRSVDEADAFVETIKEGK